MQNSVSSQLKILVSTFWVLKFYISLLMYGPKLLTRNIWILQDLLVLEMYVINDSALLERQIWTQY